MNILNIFEKLGHFFGLLPEYWLDYKMCSPDWFVGFAWWCGLFVLVAYFSFSVLAIKIEKEVRTKFQINYLFASLSVVFFFCGAIHFVHVQSKFTPQVLILLIFLLPSICAAMSFLLYYAYTGYFKLKNIINDNDTLISQQKREIKKLSALISEYQVTETSINLLKSRLLLLRTNEEAKDAVIPVEKGKTFDIPIYYDRWTKYSINGAVCRLIGVYLNDESTLTLNEFPKCNFPLHHHGHTETVVSIKGDIVMNGRKMKKGESIHFAKNEPHDLQTDGAIVAVIWNKKINRIKGFSI